MDVEQQVLEGRQVRAVAGRGHVLGEHHGHVRVEVEAGVQAQVAVLLAGQAREADGLVEVREVVAHGDGRGREHDVAHLGQPALRQVGTHVELLGDEALRGDAAIGAGELRGVDVALVGSGAHQADAGEQIAQEARGLPQVGGELRCLGREGRGSVGQQAHGLVEGVLASAARVADGSPLGCLSDRGVDPQRHEVVAALARAGQGQQLVDGHEEVGHAHGRARDGRGRLGEKPHEQRGALERGALGDDRVQDAGPLAAQQLEGGAGLVAADLDGPLAAGLGLEGVGLVDDPAADGRQDLAVGGDVAQEQRVVGDDDVRAAGAAAGAVEQALVGEVRASAAQALAGLGGEHRAGDVAPANAQGVEVAVGRLRRERAGDGDGGEHVGSHGVVRAPVVGHGGKGELLSHGAVHAVQARVVVVALEAREGEAAGQGRGESGQLVRDELVGERVGLGGDAHGDVVALGVEDRGQQVGDGLADAGAGLDGAVGAVGERGRDLAGHGDLLGAALQALVHARHGAVGGERGLHLFGGGGAHGVEVGGVGALAGVEVAGQGRAVRLEREVLAGVGQRRHVRDDGTERPVDLRVHVGELPEQAGWQVRQAQEQDAPHAAEGVDVVGGAVGHRAAAEGGRHVREAVRQEARQRDAREREAVDPDVRDLAAARDALDEGAVERGVVGQDGRAADELGEGGDGLGGRGGARHVDVVDVGEERDLGRNGPTRVDEGLEALDHVTAAQARSGDLDELAVLEREARGLRVEDDDVLLERAERAREGALREGAVPLGDRCGRAGEQQLLQRGCVLLHALAPPLRGVDGVFDEARAQLGERDAAVAESGSRLSAVIPGMVLVSRMTGSPSAVTMKSLREQPEQPRARWARTARCWALA